MLTSFFGKSKPVHFIILGGLMVLGFIYTHLATPFTDSTQITIIESVFYMLVLVLSIIVIDFIITRNHLTESNAYAIFFFSIFMLIVSRAFLHPQIILANFFLILALRRIISLRKDNNSEKKILDAAVWITIAAFIYFWCILLFIPLVIALFQKPNLTYKQALIPFVGFFATILLYTAYNGLSGPLFAWIGNWFVEPNVEFRKFHLVTEWVPLVLLLLILVFTLLFRWKNLGATSIREKTNFMVFITIILSSAFISYFGKDMEGSEIIFLFVPTSILFAHYMETKPKYNLTIKHKFNKGLKEGLCWTLILVALLLLFW